MSAVQAWGESPLGRLRLLAVDGALAGLWFEDHVRMPEVRAGAGNDPILDEARRQLDAWFAGDRTSFDLPLRPVGTPFQLRVWAALRAIPAGETRTYGDLARVLGLPGAARAVGSANARNPISIVVPCHRVVGSDGTLTGYAGGVERKRWLLAHERRLAPQCATGRCGRSRR